MSKFNVLPTDERFLKLTTNQIMFILDSMEIDSLIASGKDISNFVEDETFSYEGDMDMPSEEEQDDVWAQLQSMRPDNLKATLKDKMGKIQSEEENPEPNLVLDNMKAERARRLKSLGLVDTATKDPLLDDDVDTL